jgi:hypothetical protein
MRNKINNNPLISQLHRYLDNDMTKFTSDELRELISVIEDAEKYLQMKVGDANYVIMDRSGMLNNRIEYNNMAINRLNGWGKFSRDIIRAMLH